MSFGYGFSLPNWQTLSGGAFSPAQLFQGGVQGAWYDPSDSTTLFSDRAGTTPCGTPGQGSVVPVGLMLDKSQGLVLGANVQNGGFDTDTVWTKNGWVISGGTASYAGGAGAAIEQTSPVTLSAGDLVKVTVTVSAITAGFVYAWVAGGVTSALGVTATRANGVGTYTWYFPIATVTNQNVGIYCGNGPTGIVIDNVTIQRVSGNHAIAANDTTARPELRARVNLLTYSEQFDNAAWVKSALTVTVNSTTAPDGTLTADTLIEGSGAVQPVIYQALASLAGVLSFYVKANGRNFVQILNSTSYANFDLSNGTVGSVVGFTNSAISSVGSGWYRISTVIPSSTVVGVALIGSGTATYRQSYTGDGTSGIYLWGAQLTATNEFPANTYQRIVDANTYDAVGFPRYLAFNGTSSAMSTPGNVNLSGTDKATWFLGARKISDVNWKWAFAFNNPVGNSSFGLTLPEDAGQPNMGFYLRGTASVTYVPTGYVAPLNLVLSAACDLAAATKATSLVPKVNGTVQQTAGSGTTPGGGTFASAILSIGGYSVQLFQGNIYSIIVVGSAVSAGNITSTEQWVAGKVGITI